MTVAEHIGARLKALREARGLTQRDVALRAGIHQSMISRVENGRVGVTLDALERQAKALGVRLVVDAR